MACAWARKYGIPNRRIAIRPEEVYLKPLTCVSDDPVHYQGQPGLEFLHEVPTVWDETRFLQGDPVRDIVLARRSGSRWFLGAMTADAGRSPFPSSEEAATMSSPTPRIQTPATSR